MTGKGMLALLGVGAVLVFLGTRARAYMSPSNQVEIGSNNQYTIHLENFEPSETVTVTTDLTSFPATIEVDPQGNYVSSPMSAQAISLLFALLNKNQTTFTYVGQQSDRTASFVMQLV